ncbi:MULTISPECIES: hypothetical protein [Campylobacter]|nr:hypothetical protein [Campylobacter lari]MCR6511428.1 hypothetical protein [Campylobacter lari]
MAFNNAQKGGDLNVTKNHYSYYINNALLCQGLLIYPALAGL